MKVLIPIVIGLLVVGCGKKQTNNTDKGNNTPENSAKKEVEETPSKGEDKSSTKSKPVKELPLEEKITGIYEEKTGENTTQVVLLKNGVVEGYYNGKKNNEGIWKVVDGELYFTDEDESGADVHRINKDGSITFIANIGIDGKRHGRTKDRQFTLKKVEDTKPAAPKNDDKNTYDSVSDEEAITVADKLVRVYVKALAEKNLEMLLQQSPKSLPDEDYKQWTKALWLANLGHMKKEISDMLKVLEDPDPEMKAFLAKLQTEPDKVIEDELEQKLEMRKISMNGPRMEIAKKEFIVERNTLGVAESDWGKVDVSKVKIVRFKQRNVMKEIPFPNRQVEVTLEVDGREIENTIRMEIVKLPGHGWKYINLEIHQKPGNPKK